MNILFLNSAKSWGGNEQWTNLAAHGLAEKHGVHLAYRSEAIGGRFGVPRHRLPFLSEVDPITFFQLRRLIKRQDIDVLIPTKRKDYRLAGFAARSKGIKNVLRLGIVRHLNKGLVSRLVHDTLCDGIIVNAEAIKRELLRSDFVGSEKIRVVHNGVDIDFIHGRAAEQNGFVKPFEFMISSMGELSERKGFDFLLRGFADFLRNTNSMNKCGLQLIGSGVEERRIKDLARELNIDRNILLAGFQENPFPMLAAGDLFILTSRNEGISNAMLEAMALKIPIVATDVDGAAEVIQDRSNGFLVEWGRQEKLAKLMGLLYRDANKRKSIALAGYETVRQEFSGSKMCRQIEGFLNSVLVAEKVEKLQSEQVEL